MAIIETECGPVDCVESGDGPSVLYFHGTGMLPIEKPIADSGFRLIIPNRPGYGDTPLAENRSAVNCAAVAASLLDALNLDSACIMGSSGGATFATSFAIHHPERKTESCPHQRLLN